MPRPKLPAEPTASDRWMRGLAITSLAALLTVSVVGYAEVPATIPLHFGADGWPDQYGSRWMYWMFPLLGCFLLGLFWWLLGRTHRLEYPIRITRENAAVQYRTAAHFLLLLASIILLALTYIQYTIIQTTEGETSGLGSWFAPTLAVAVIGTTVGYVALAHKRA